MNKLHQFRHTILDDDLLGKAVKNIVSAINATEVKVTFNKAVLESTVEDATNYAFTSVAPATPAPLAVDDIQLQADGKTAIVRFTAPTVEGVTYKATIVEVL